MLLVRYHRRVFFAWAAITDVKITSGGMLRVVARSPAASCGVPYAGYDSEPLLALAERLAGSDHSFVSALRDAEWGHRG